MGVQCHSISGSLEALFFWSSFWFSHLFLDLEVHNQQSKFFAYHLSNAIMLYFGFICQRRTSQTQLRALLQRLQLRLYQ